MTEKPTYDELVRRIAVLEKEKAECDKFDERLRLSEARYRGIFEHTRNGVAIYRAVDGGADFIFEDFNRSAEKIENISREAVIGKSVLDVFPAVKIFGLFEVFQRVYRTGRPEHHPVSMYEDHRISGWRDNYVYRLPSGEIVAVYSDETETKQNETYLNYFQKAVAMSSVAVGLSSPDGKHWYQNTAFDELFGDIGDDPPATLFADRAEGRRIFTSVMSGEEWSGEVRMFAADGNLLDIFLFANAIKDNTGRIIGLVGIHSDISAQKERERKLRETRSLLENVILQSPIPMAVATPDGVLKIFNDACREQLMIEAGDGIEPGVNLLEMRPTWKDYDKDGNFVPTDQLPLALALQGKTSKDLEIRVVRKDGSERWEIVNGSPVYDGHQKLIAGFVTFPDITSRKKAEEALRREKEFNEFALNAQTDTFFVFDPESGRAVRWNRAFRKISGYSDEEIRLQKAPDRYYSPEDLAKAAEAIRHVFERGNATVVISLITKDGKRIPTEYNVSLLENMEEGRTFMVSIGRDISERLDTEEALRAGRERLDLALDIGNAGIWEWNLATNELYLDDRFRMLLGYERGEEEKNLPKDIDKWAKYHHPDEFSNMMDKVQSHLAGETEIYESEHRLKSKSGKWIWIYTRGKAVNFNNEGIPEWIVGIAVDITARKESEKALLESQRFVRHIVEATPNLLYIYHLVERRNVFANMEMLEFLGYTTDQIRTKGERLVESVIHPDDVQDAMEHHRRLQNASDGDIRELTYRVRHANGNWRWLKSRDVPFTRSSDGRVKEILGIAEDITDHRATLESLKISEERYRHLYASMAEGVCVHELIFDADQKPADYRILDINPAYEAITGLRREAAIGAKASELYGSEEPPYLDLYARVAMDGEPASFETYFPPMDKHFEISVFCHQRGKFATVFNDITERKHSEKIREKLETQLRQSQKMEAVGTLAGGIAHDFNNILGIILGNTELAIDDTPETHRMQKNLDAVKKACVRAREVIRQLLSFSRQTEQERRIIQIRHIVKETLTLIRSSFPSSIEIRQQIASDIHNIQADPAQMHQVIINLCTNAAHAMEETDGVLEVHLKNCFLDEETVLQYPNLAPGNYVHLSVSDTGCGIPPEIRHRIFDPYFTTKEVGRGTGMGLSVVHGIVKNHGGVISVYSEVGSGSVFRIFLPAVEADETAETYISDVIPTGNERILFVDDEEALLDMGKQMLERIGYSVVTFSDPLSALAHFQEAPGAYDLVLTDLTMPGLTGDRLAANLKNIRADIPIVLCTGFSARMTPEKAGEIGIDRFFEKPLNKKELARVIRMVLDQASGGKE